MQIDGYKWKVHFYRLYFYIEIIGIIITINRNN